jgi:long-chain acyl-CoA synthetase
MTTDTQNIAEFLLQGKQEARVVLWTINGEYTYGDLRLTSADVAKYLVAAGGRKGDRVILVDYNSFFWVAVYLGILRAGLVCVPLPPSLPSEDFDYIVQVTEPRFAFLQAGVIVRHGIQFQGLSLVTDCDLHKRPGLPLALSLAKLQASVTYSETTRPQVKVHDLAALMFTSGSTGRPRGVMVSHGNLRANTDSIVQYLSLTKNDRIMTVLPFHYCFGTSLLHTHLHVGGSLVLDSRFLYPEKVLERMEEIECTGFAGVPSHFQILLRKTNLRKHSFPHLRYVQQAGGHLAPKFIRELREALPHTQIFVMYGQTEATARLSYLPTNVLDTKLGSIGKGIPGVGLQVLDESGREVLPGEVGEIVAEGANVALGYWRAPGESAVSFRNGKLYTGDLATVDTDGFIYIVDRAKDFLKCGGKRISCRQVEERLLEFDGLLEAAVVGIPDDVLGEAVKAFVVACDGNSTALRERLRHFCRERLPFQFVPKEIVVLDFLPKNSAGKVLRQELK